jgi:TRAP-type C4-dicarboxylate transport system permease small subunit
MNAATKRRPAPLLDGFVRMVRLVNRLFSMIAQIMVGVLVVVVLIDVAMRYFFNAPTIWATDIARYLLLFIFFTALAPALQSGHHVAVDLFDKLLPPILRRAQPLVGSALIIFFGLFFTWQLWRTFAQAVDDNALANSLLVLPLKNFYWIGPLGALQFVLTAIAMMTGRLPKPARGIE